MDIVTQSKRSEMMAGIKGKDTKPEISVRKELFKRGYRYRVNVKNLPGKPDIVFPKFSAVVFVNGCFWHQHECHLFKWPGTRPDFWKKKIGGNRDRDIKVRNELLEAGWRVLTVWECALKGKTKMALGDIVGCIEAWLESGEEHKEIEGRQN